MHTAHDELKVKAAGDKAALQARIDRKTAELEQVIEARENEDNEKEELRAKMAATQAHAVQVQKAALKYVPTDLPFLCLSRCHQERVVPLH